MHRRATDAPGHADLVRIIRGVRRRWRLKLALRGLAVVVAAGLVAFLLGTLVVDWLSFSPAAVLTVRILLGVLVVGLLGALLLLPLGRRVTDEQVALYLEEKEPSLRASLISALEAGSAHSSISPGLARRTIETALARCRAVDDGRRIELRSLARYSGVLSGAVATGLLLFLAGPAFVRLGSQAILLPLRDAEAASVRRVSVLPGDTSLARGADLPVTALLSGFTSDQVDLLMRVEGDSTFERLPMLLRPDSGDHEVRLFDVDRPIEYYVESEGVRSPAYRVTVLELPYVDQLEVELRFPAYTGLPPQRLEEGGDVAAPAGTLVRLRARSTLPVSGGRVVLSDGRSAALSPDSSGTLSGEFRMVQSGLYHLELQPPSGGAVNGSPQYLMDVLEDRRPAVSFSAPGRDTRATSVDEVFVEAQADDDYGVRAMELVYTVNGGPEQKVRLYDGQPSPEVTAGHTLYLEEMDLQAGDFISYYARVVDVGPGTRQPVTSDIYFLEIRPYGREYRQADAGGAGMGGGGGQEGADGQLSQRQRELIAATFNLVRDRARYPEKEYRENLTALWQAQEKLREQAETLALRLSNRGVMRDSSFRNIAQALPQAAKEMQSAIEQLRSDRPSDALPPEQRALLHLQRVEAAFREVQVSMGGAAAGGGGGGAGPNAEDLADLFGLELDKLRNQYETVQRGERQQAQAEVDQTLDRVRELARRMERENERLRQMMASQQMRNGNGAASQRQLAQETEEAARRLERLSREQARPDLAEAARRLQDAAEAMRRAAADERRGNAGAARAALDRLREAARRLERSQGEGAQQEARDLARRAEQLAEEQEEISEQMRGLRTAGSDRAAQARRLVERKDRQAAEVAEMERQLDSLAVASRQSQPNASRRMQAAAESIRRNQVKEKIRASRAGTQAGAPEEYTRQMEGEISSDLEELERLTREASESFQSGGGDQSEQSLDRARDLVRGLESLQERTRQARNDPSGRQPGLQQSQSESAGQRQSPQGGQPQAGRGQGQGGQQDGQRGSQSGQPQAGQSGAQAGQQQDGQPQGSAGGSQQGGQQGGQGQQQGQGQGQPGGQQSGQQGGGAQAGGQSGQPQGGRGQGGGERQGDGFDSPGTGWIGGPAAGSPSEESVRQLRGEIRQRLSEARELREELVREGIGVQDLDRAIATLRELDNGRVYADWDELQKLQAAVVDRVKQFEFTLRQQVEGEQSRRLFLSGSTDVPPAYRELVERYYRELAEKSRR